MKKIIMVVDDTPDMLYTLKSCLEELSDKFEVITVDSGKKCLDLLKKIKPDLIFLDIMMDEMNGWDVCAAIKNDKKTSSIPIVFLTAKTEPISVSFGKMGSEGYITKPFEMDDLKGATDKYIK